MIPRAPRPPVYGETAEARIFVAARQTSVDRLSVVVYRLRNPVRYAR